MILFEKDQKAYVLKKRENFNFNFCFSNFKGKVNTIIDLIQTLNKKDTSSLQEEEVKKYEYY